MKYKVKAILEDLDFGCEERRQGEPVKAVVILEDGQGRETQVRLADALLYEEGIEEGSMIFLDEEGNFRKIVGK